MAAKKQIVILGGGFGGVYTALHLEKQFKHDTDVKITLINDENFLLFTPMLHEIAAADLDAGDIVNPLRKLLRKTQLFCGAVDDIDLQRKSVTVSHGAMHHSHELPFDYLVLALGSVTQFYNLPGLAENALTMRSLGDAIHLRNHVIGCLEEADFECVKDLRSRLLTFVVAGGGFAGVETAAAVHDFIKGIIKFYPNLSMNDVRVVLAHSGNVLLPELSRPLGKYTGDLLSSRGIEIRFQTKVTCFQENVIEFSDASTAPCATLVWTAGSSPNPLIEKLDCIKERGRILVKRTLDLSQYPEVFAVGDCAAIPNGEPGAFHPPTAQHAIREAKTAAYNIAASIRGGTQKEFRFKTLGQLASLGHRKGVAQVMGFRFSGLVAWMLWRTIYLMKLPRFEKRLRVALNWTLDLLFEKDNVQLPTTRTHMLVSAQNPMNILKQVVGTH